MQRDFRDTALLGAHLSASVLRLLGVGIAFYQLTVGFAGLVLLSHRAESVADLAQGERSFRGLGITRRDYAELGDRLVVAPLVEGDLADPELGVGGAGAVGKAAHVLLEAALSEIQALLGVVGHRGVVQLELADVFHRRRVPRHRLRGRWRRVRAELLDPALRSADR